MENPKREFQRVFPELYEEVEFYVERLPDFRSMKSKEALASLVPWDSRKRWESLLEDLQTFSERNDEFDSLFLDVINAEGEEAPIPQNIYNEITLERLKEFFLTYPYFSWILIMIRPSMRKYAIEAGYACWLMLPPEERVKYALYATDRKSLDCLLSDIPLTDPIISQILNKYNEKVIPPSGAETFILYLIDHDYVSTDPDFYLYALGVPNLLVISHVLEKAPDFGIYNKMLLRQAIRLSSIHAITALEPKDLSIEYLVEAARYSDSSTVALIASYTKVKEDRKASEDPLYIASIKNTPESVKELLLHNLDPFKEKNNGLSPFIASVFNVPVFRYYLNHYNYEEIRNEIDRAIRYAATREAGYDTIFMLIEEYGYSDEINLEYALGEAKENGVWRIVDLIESFNMSIIHISDEEIEDYDEELEEDIDYDDYFEQRESVNPFYD